jgi:hypothetical protein
MFNNDQMEEIFKGYVEESKKRGSNLIYNQESLLKLFKDEKSKRRVSILYKKSKSFKKTKKE